MPKLPRIPDAEWKILQRNLRETQAEDAAAAAERRRAEARARFEEIKQTGTPEEIIEILRLRPNDEKLCFGYRRCSSESSKLSHVGLDAQEEGVNQYFKLIALEHPELHWGGWLVDEAVSAYAYRLFERPDGARLLDVMRPGDHLIVWKLDRIFRDVIDTHTTVKFFQERKMVLHSAVERFDMDSDTGWLMMSMLAVMAEMEARQTSARMKACNAERRRKNLPIGNPPAGFKVVGDKGKRAYAFDERERSIMGEIVRVKQGIGKSWSWTKISDWIEKCLAEQEQRPMGNTFHRESREFNPQQCKRVYKQEVAIRETVEQLKKQGVTEISAGQMVSYLRGYQSL